jgi:hypothetical protein
VTEELTLDAPTIGHIKAVSDSGEVFGKAIDEGRLSDDETAPNYAGKYMFMGYQGGTGKARMAVCGLVLSVILFDT